MLILQEVISAEQVQAVAAALDLPHGAISDFSPPVSITGNPLNSIEVAILSHSPIARAAEWDTTGRGQFGDDFPPRTSSDLVATEELAITIPMNDKFPAQGFLRVSLWRQGLRSKPFTRSRPAERAATPRTSSSRVSASYRQLASSWMATLASKLRQRSSSVATSASRRPAGRSG